MESEHCVSTSQLPTWTTLQNPSTSASPEPAYQPTSNPVKPEGWSKPTPFSPAARRLLTEYYQDNKYPSHTVKEEIALKIIEVDHQPCPYEKVNRWFARQRLKDGTTERHGQPTNEGDWVNFRKILSHTPQSVWTEDWLYTIFSSLGIGPKAGMAYVEQARSYAEALASPVKANGPHRPPTLEIPLAETRQLPTPASSLSPELKARSPISLAGPRPQMSAPVLEHHVPDRGPAVEARPAQQTPSLPTKSPAHVPAALAHPSARHMPAAPASPTGHVSAAPAPPIAGYVQAALAPSPLQPTGQARQSYTSSSPYIRLFEIAQNSEKRNSSDVFPLIASPPTNRQQWAAQFDPHGSLMDRLLRRGGDGTLRLHL